jgi:hypothetical protein
MLFEAAVGSAFSATLRALLFSPSGREQLRTVRGKPLRRAGNNICSVKL